MKFVVKLLSALLVIVLIGVAFSFGAIYTFEQGPSQAGKELFVRTAQETSRFKWLATLFLSDEEVAEIMDPGVGLTSETDVSLISVPSASGEDPAPAGNYGFPDEDGDGIVIASVKGSGYRGYMMIVLDPTRVILGYTPGTGRSVERWCDYCGAVAGINAGGFTDQTGNVSSTGVVYEGKTYVSDNLNNFAGFDSSGILHVGDFTKESAAAADIRYGISFGPALIINGEMAENLGSGLNPRTAIGQRADGAVLMLVIEGRSVMSIGASLQDVAEVMRHFGAVNACNLDGGSSTMMYCNGDYVSISSDLIGTKSVATAFLVLPKEGEA